MAGDLAGIVGGRDRVDSYAARHPEHLTVPFVSVCLAQKNDKMPPICAFLAVYNKLPKLRTWVRFPSPAPEIHKIPVDSAALTHQAFLDLRSKG